MQKLKQLSILALVALVMIIASPAQLAAQSRCDDPIIITIPPTDCGGHVVAERLAIFAVRAEAATDVAAIADCDDPIIITIPPTDGCHDCAAS